MFTHNYFIKKNGKLYLRLRNNNRKTELSLQHRATQEELDEALILLNVKRGRNYSRLKPHLEFYELKIRLVEDALIDEGRIDEDVSVIREMLEVAFGLASPENKAPDPKGAFVTHYTAFIDSKTNSGTKGVYKHTLDRIRLFDPDIDKKNFEDIDLKWLVGFEAFCARTASKNARNIHLRNIRAVFNNAIDYEITTAYPFRRFKIRPEATRKRSLSVEELRRLFNYPVEHYAEIYRDCFKLIFMLCGINTVDLWGLKSITKDGRIEYKRAKTGRLYSIKVEPEAMVIIEKYRGEKGLLCIADRWNDSRNFRHQLNKALQRIGHVERKGRGGKKIITAEFEGVSSYWARHSWATIAYNDLSISKDIIAQALGHSGGETVTDIYLDKDSRLVDDANRRVIDWVLYGKR